METLSDKFIKLNKEKMFFKKDVKEFIKKYLDTTCDNEEFRKFCEEWKHAPTSELEKYIAWSKMKLKKEAGPELAE